MNIAERYRTSTDYKEILRILQRSTTETDNFLWQPTESGKNILKITHFEIDFVGREVVVHLERTQSKLLEGKPLYMKLEHRGSVFKIPKFYISQSAIRFAFPEIVKALEFRGTPRVTLDLSQEKVVSFRPTLSVGQEASDLQVRVSDISEQGVGLIVSEHNRQYLKFNRILWLTRLGDQSLEFPILAEVVYMNSDLDPKLQRRRMKELKVGVKLSGHLPPEPYQKFIQ